MMGEGSVQNTQASAEVVSDPADSIDQLVEKASVPNLAALFRKGKEAGLIKPGKEYGNST